MLYPLSFEDQCTGSWPICQVYLPAYIIYYLILIYYGKPKQFSFKEPDKPYNILICGLPNTGKSSLVNALRRKYMKKGMGNVFTGDGTAILCGHPSHKKI